MSVETVALDCPACPATFSGPNRLAEYNTHRREAHARPESEGLRCVQCPGRFPDQEALDRHAEVVHGPALCPAPGCTFRAPNRQGLTVHRKREHGMGDRKPGWDGKAVESEPTPESPAAGPATSSEAAVSDSTITRCPECGRPISRAQLGNHRRWKHPDVEAPSAAAGRESSEARVAGSAGNNGVDETRPESEKSTPAASTLPPDRESVEEAHRWESAVSALDEALNRFGWHLDTCPAYWHGSNVLDRPASDLDNVRFDCTCGFRDALALAVAS